MSDFSGARPRPDGRKHDMTQGGGVRVVIYEFRDVIYLLTRQEARGKQQIRRGAGGVGRVCFHEMQRREAHRTI